MDPVKEILAEHFAQVGAIVTGSHIVYAKKEKGWFHGEAYVNKDVISMHPLLLNSCAANMTNQVLTSGIFTQVQVVAAPAVGAIAWGQVLAHMLITGESTLMPSKNDILFVFAEKIPDPDKKEDYQFEFRKVFQDIIKGKGVLIAEDISNPGTSAKKVAKAVEACGGNVVGISVLCNRSGQQAHDYLSPYKLLAVADVSMEMFHEDVCPLCQKGVPLNMSLGKAKDWLATEKGQAWATKYMK